MSATFVAKTDGDSGAGTNATITVTAPAGITAGDRLVVGMLHEQSAVFNTIPAGWTEIHSGGASPLTYWIKKAGGAEPASWVWVTSLALTWVYGCVLYTGSTRPDQGWDTTNSASVFGSGTGAVVGGVITGAVCAFRNLLYVAVFGQNAQTSLVWGTRFDYGYTARVARIHNVNINKNLVMGEIIGGESPTFFPPVLALKYTGNTLGNSNGFAGFVNKETDVAASTEPPVVVGADAWAWSGG